jgi:hypothetical protein
MAIPGSLVTLGLAKLVNLMLADNGPLKKFYNYLYTDYNPDITGYTLLFMIPPNFSAEEYKDGELMLDQESNLFTQVLSMIDVAPEPIATLQDFSKVYPFFASDFTPPQTEVQNAQVQSRTGALAYAADVIETETVSVQFIEANPLVVYKFHLLWVQYIRDILRGAIKPAAKYIDPTAEGANDCYGTQDYLASFYVVKYILDMKEISYIGKCVGVYPLILPSGDLIGSRLTNEITMLPIEYVCVAYREYVEGLKTNLWLKTELETFLDSNFSFQWENLI